LVGAVLASRLRPDRPFADEPPSQCSTKSA
jgi:hypothetical protein